MVFLEEHPGSTYGLYLNLWFTGLVHCHFSHGIILIKAVWNSFKNPLYLCITKRQTHKKGALNNWTSNVINVCVCVFYSTTEQYKLLSDHIEKMAAEWVCGRQTDGTQTSAISHLLIVTDCVVTFVWCTVEKQHNLLHWMVPYSGCSKPYSSNVIVLLCTLSRISNNTSSSVGACFNMNNNSVCDLLNKYWKQKWNFKV